MFGQLLCNPPASRCPALPWICQHAASVPPPASRMHAPALPLCARCHQTCSSNSHVARPTAACAWTHPPLPCLTCPTGNALELNMINGPSAGLVHPRSCILAPVLGYMVLSHAWPSRPEHAPSPTISLPPYPMSHVVLSRNCLVSNTL
jgi:hypothetical protein